MKLRWQARTAPLAPTWALARGPAAARLVARLLERDDASLARLSGVAGAGLVLVGGPAEELPWIDGIEYLGVDGAAPRLRLPTTLAPGLPVDWLERALLTAHPETGLLAVAPGLCVPLAEARRIERARLLAWSAA